MNIKRKKNQDHSAHTATIEIYYAFTITRRTIGG